MSQQRRRGRAWKPDTTGKRCMRCARTWDGHAGTSCYPVPDPAIDAFDPARPELLELGDGDVRSGRQVDVGRDASGVASRPRLRPSPTTASPTSPPASSATPSARGSVSSANADTTSSAGG